eukprot:2246737-Pyramimonas_sp.AAC.1
MLVTFDGPVTMTYLGRRNKWDGKLVDHQFPGGLRENVEFVVVPFGDTCIVFKGEGLITREAALHNDVWVQVATAHPES